MDQSEVCICKPAWKRTGGWGDDELYLLIELGRGCIKAELASNLSVIELSRRNFVKDQRQKHVQMKSLFDFDARGSQEKLWNWGDFNVLHHEL